MQKKILVIKQLVNGWTKIIIDILTFNPLLTRYFSVISPAAENCLLIFPVWLGRLVNFYQLLSDES